MPQDALNPEKSHRAQILRQAISYIQSIRRENQTMRAQLGQQDIHSSQAQQQH